MPTLFTPVSAALGGLMIGLSAIVLFWILGRVAGISGILNKVIDASEGRAWRLVFLLSLMLGAAAMFKVFDLRAGNAVVSMPWLIASGLLWARARGLRTVAQAVMAFAVWRGSQGAPSLQ